MQVVYERCCGLDIHKKLVVACLIVLAANGQRHKEIRTFRTVTQDLLLLKDWLAAAGCTHIAMESTGVYWKPIFNLLEGDFELLVVNAQHIKAVPGRKTDVRDAEWIADLVHHGLLKGSFIPPTPQRELRDLTRHRTSLVQDRARVVNRLRDPSWRIPISSWGMSRPISWGNRRAPCWKPCLPAKRIPRSWQTWPVGGCAARFPR